MIDAPSTPVAVVRHDRPDSALPRVRYVRSRRLLALLTLIFALPAAVAGCSTLGSDRKAAAVEIAGAGGLEPVTFDAGDFVLQGFWRGRDRADPDLTVYIEGDGLAWLSKTRLSRDPTPRNPLALSLAAADRAAKVLYLARPCQYTTPETARICNPKYWSTHRFAPEAVAALDTAIDQAKKRMGASRVTLIGYSGGGVAATLLAERRTDVAALATVASPLDLDNWVRWHQVTPLYGSLAPVDQADRLKSIPQVHFAGDRDDVVPPDVVRTFLARLGPTGTDYLVTIHGADHACCWLDQWPDLRSRLPGTANRVAIAPPLLPHALASTTVPQP